MRLANDLDGTPRRREEETGRGVARDSNRATRDSGARSETGHPSDQGIPDHGQA